ncbi:MAG: DUF4388 domain-containing protein [Polyangia bacterium]
MAIIPSPATGTIPFQSTVQELPLPVALERLFAAQATGVLTLDARQGHHVVYLRDGYPVAVELPGSFELLGRVLVEMKLLDETTYQTTLSSPPPQGQRYGETLLSMGLITEDQLRQALKAQVRRKLHRLFFLTDSSVAFEPMEHQEGVQRNESLRVHPWRATYHGVRSAWNADRLRQALMPLGGMLLHTSLRPEEVARFGLGANDGVAVSLLRDKILTLDALITESGLPLQPVCALVYALFVSSTLEDPSIATPSLATTPSGAYSIVSARRTPIGGISAVPKAPMAAQPQVFVPPAPEQPPMLRPPAATPQLNSPAPPAQPHVTPHPITQPAVVIPAPIATAASPPSAAAQELEQLVDTRRGTIDADDLFTVLGVQRTATPEQIKTAYLESARRYHPDRLAALGLQRLREDVEKIFSRVSEAQSVLLDDTRRMEYLATLDKPKPSAEDAAAHQTVIAALEADGIFRRGQTLLRRNDLNAALKDFATALATVPTEGEHVIYVAWTRHCLDQLGLAETRTEIQRGLKLSPRCASGFYFLGMLYKEEDSFDAAMVDFKRAVALDERQFDAAQEIRILELRRSKGGEKKSLFDRFRKSK